MMFYVKISLNYVKMLTVNIHNEEVRFFNAITWYWFRNSNIYESLQIYLHVNDV